MSVLPETLLVVLGVLAFEGGAAWLLARLFAPGLPDAADSRRR